MTYLLSDSYEKARKKLTIAEVQSDLQTEEEDEELTRRVKEETKVYITLLECM